MMTSWKAIRQNLPVSELEAFAHAARERLAFIEYQAYFCGALRRSDLESRFGIKEAAATRDIQAYRVLVPANLSYDASAKMYVPDSAFKAVFPMDRGRILGWLADGFVEGLQSGSYRKPIALESVPDLGLPGIETLSAVTRAIYGRRALRITYWSMTSGESVREIVPSALVDNGLRWHVRAFDRAKARFSDFVIARIANPEPLDSPINESEMVIEDRQWNRYVDLELVPHPGIKFPEVIEREMAMTDGVLRIQSRAAVVGYLLHRWGVDCSPKHTLSAESHHMWLRNLATLYGVESAWLAPGA